MKKFITKQIKYYLSLLVVIAVFITGCVNNNSNLNNNSEKTTQSTQEVTNNKENSTSENSTNNTTNENSSNDNANINSNTSNSNTSTSQSTESKFKGYKLIKVDGGDLSGHREPNVVVDIGYGDREYWAFTNEYGQLVKVIADKIILQDDKKEPVTSNGRYYKDEAKVPGVERSDLDEGHVIADSLGGVSNAYNITPQNSTLNRHGDQAYMEKNIRDAGGCTDFVAIITYPNTTTQIPSHYSYTYTLKGKVIKDEFDNVNPDKTNTTTKSTNKNNKNTTTKNKNNNVNVNSKNKNNNTATTSKNKNNTSTVYWTPNGKSYHTTKSCPTLSRSKTILSGTVAQSGKKDPCDRCH